jgi:hypothetical protein
VPRIRNPIIGRKATKIRHAGRLDDIASANRWMACPKPSFERFRKTTCNFCNLPYCMPKAQDSPNPIHVHYLFLQKVVEEVECRARGMLLLVRVFSSSVTHVHNGNARKIARNPIAIWYATDLSQITTMHLCEPSVFGPFLFLSQ